MNQLIHRIGPLGEPDHNFVDARPAKPRRLVGGCRSACIAASCVSTSTASVRVGSTGSKDSRHHTNSNVESPPAVSHVSAAICPRGKGRQLRAFLKRNPLRSSGLPSSSTSEEFEEPIAGF